MTSASVRYRVPRFAAVAVALALGAFVQWPALHWNPWPPVVLYWVVGVALVLGGVLLGGEPAQRGTAGLLIASGFVWLLNDLGSRLYGVLPLIGWVSKPVDELLLTVIVLRYPHPRISDPFTKRVLAVTITVFLTVYLAGGLTWSPAWYGATFWWPTVLPLREAAGYISRASDSAGLIAAVVAIGLVVRRFRRAGGLDRRELVPVLVSTAALGANIVVIQALVIVTGREARFGDTVSVLDSFLTLAVPLAFGAAALGLENARLHADLLAQLEELQESRTRIVEAGIEQRRQVERDLHDGAQQQLLALAATIGRAHTVAADPTMRQLMDQARTELRRALKDLRDLARGIHPAVLEQVGLPAAVEAVSESLPHPVQLRIDLGRLSPTTEATAYFVICEALANATKHANATRVQVTAERHDGTLSVTVEDDGTGAIASPGGGLAGLSDRVTALGGRLTVHSPAGAGTRLTAELPCE
jgi:signal transduction histidine kinase